MTAVRSEKYLDAALNGRGGLGDHQFWIDQAFYWKGTEQGQEFWERVYQTRMSPTAYYELFKIKKSHTESKAPKK